MNDEKRIRELIRNVPIGTHDNTDRAVREKILAAGRERILVGAESGVSGRPGKPFLGKFAAAAAAVLIAGCLFVAGGVVFNFAGRAGWSVRDSIDALSSVESVIIRNSTNLEDDVFVHVKGGLFSNNVRARYETDGAVFIHNEHKDVAIEKGDGDEIYGWGFETAGPSSYYSRTLRQRQAMDNYAAMLLPIVGSKAEKSAAVSVERVEVKKYYVVSGVDDAAGMRFRTIVDAETNLPVSTTRWSEGDGSVVLKSEAMEYNADIPDEIFEYYQPR